MLIFQKNIKILDAIYALNPDNKQAQREKASNLSKIGNMWLILGNTEQALQTYQQGLEIRKKLAAADPLNT